MEHIQFSARGKAVDVFISDKSNQPVIYLNTFGKEGEQVLEIVKKMRPGGYADFSLAAISELEWDRDMAPWDIPPISKDDTPCIGGADDYLQLLVNEILPQTEKEIKGTVPWRGLAGYSLAGLFALYSVYNTEMFDGIASMSGSLWFPKFKEYAMTQKIKKIPRHLYLSLGDKECETKNKFLKSVLDNTEELYDYYKSLGIDTEFVLNPGNHFVNAAERTALGINWLLSKYN